MAGEKEALRVRVTVAPGRSVHAARVHGPGDVLLVDAEDAARLKGLGFVSDAKAPPVESAKAKAPPVESAKAEAPPVESAKAEAPPVESAKAEGATVTTEDGPSVTQTQG